jgi:hypothetical protein
MESETHSVEYRLAKLEADNENRGTLIGGLIVAAFVVYLLWSAGYLKFGVPSVQAASA